MENSQFVLNAYGFLLLGIFLIFCNLPVLVVVVFAKKLRNQYGVLIISLVNGFITGTVSTGYGIFRLVLFVQGKENYNVPIAVCFYNPLTFFLLWTFPMNGIGLLLNSIDRLLVISFPLSYFNYNTRVVVVLNIVALVVNAGIVFTAVFGTLSGSESGRMINVFCSQNDMYSEEMYIVLAALRSFFAVLAVLLMFAVLVLFMKHNHVRSKQAFHTDENIRKFKSRQMDYTKTMLISCIATIALMIIPSIIAVIGRAGALDVSGHVTTWTRFVGFLNSFNIAFLLIYRQKDIRWRLYKLINNVTRGHIFSLTEIQSTSNEHSNHVTKPKATYSSNRKPS
ncbi:hypothetical protein QR680_013903 [Steinernema hermaphroditum]|uniref:G-protein coupled receptors family 1 profile domain-containing protein n=1 Tax=Steinernema hermaphroditum TaxID=289476 RepID=A0AA39M312_9BILA|nr:hypothetical protein QR680_013903 [Steinernema hermaphroditum]